MWDGSGSGSCPVESVGCSENLLTVLVPKDDFSVAEKTSRHVKLSAKNMESMGSHLNPRSSSEYTRQLFWCSLVRCMNCKYAAYDKYLCNSVFASVTTIYVSPDKIVCVGK